jgi:hypothetical protein
MASTLLMNPRMAFHLQCVHCIDREESEVTPYNAPAAAHVFFFSFFLMCSSRDLLAVQKSTPHETKRFGTHLACRDSDVGDCSKGYKYNIAEAFRDHSMKTHPSSSRVTGNSETDGLKDENGRSRPIQPEVSRSNVLVQ